MNASLLKKYLRDLVVIFLFSKATLCVARILVMSTPITTAGKLPGGTLRKIEQ